MHQRLSNKSRGTRFGLLHFGRINGKTLRVGTKEGRAAIESFEPYFYDNMVLTLEGHFVQRAKEKKDGNPLTHLSTN